MAKLQGRIAVVTGGASGMGAEYSRVLAQNGAKVAVCDTDAERGRIIATEIGGIYLQLDVRAEDQWAEVAESVLKSLGPTTILINNAGTCPMMSVEETSTDEWRRTMAINADGPFFGIRAIVPQMKVVGGGVIVNVSSTAGITGMRGMAAYTASKSAVRGLTKAAALDLADYGIRVLSLHPALVRTPMSAHVDLAEFTRHYPIPRAGEVAELGRMLLFMVADATYSTGCEFIADGGSLL